MESKKIAVAYCRVSTDAQADDDHFGIESQKEIIQKYADEHNYEIQGWYIDEGVSGAAELDKKIEFKKILADKDIKNPPIQYVLVAKSDRIARDIKLYYYYMMKLEEKCDNNKEGVHLVSCTEEIVNDDTGLGQVYKSLMLFVAEQERKNITARTSGGREVKAKQGGYAGGRAPIGYKADRGKLVVDEEQAKTVRRIFELVDSHVSYRDMVQVLDSEGFRTQHGNTWNINALFTIIHNRKLYEGYYKYGENGEWVKGEQEAILQPKDNEDGKRD